MSDHYLPRVSENTINSTLTRLAQHVAEYEIIMRRENTELYTFMTLASQGDRDKLLASLTTYMLLRRQAEANDLERRLDRS